ncbi:MAG: ExeM/NucH family extracellular endonuclease [Chloroflexi bacterium]|nr:ExeM/NucH family extracellular endonuclease [Chloroflexota bacterium]
MLKLHKIWRLLTVAALLAGALNLTLVPVTPAKAARLNVGSFTGSTYTQNFDTLANTGTPAWANDSTLAGWYLVTDATASVTTYIVGNGSATTGGYYSYGTTSATDRALGGLASNGYYGGSGTGKAYFGLVLQNNTGSSIGGLSVAYTGEQWRANATAAQALTFEYKTSAAAPSDATAFNTASTGWTAVPAVTFTSPILTTAGALDGNSAANRANLSTTISGLSIPSNEYILLRWTDLNDSGNDHGLGIDDLTVTATPAGSNLTINDVSAAETNSGTTTFSFTVALSSPAPAGGVTFDIGTADNTATDADNDYEPNSATGVTIAAGASSTTFDVTVNGDTNFEPNETFFVNVTGVTGATVSDGQGQGTIQNDDVALPVLSINDVTIAEGNSGATIFGFVVTLDAPAPAGGVTFDVATADGTATTTDSDYAGQNLTTQIISAGSTTYNFDVIVNGDTNIELTETFDVNVTNVTGATVGDGTGLGTITNDDAATPQISISSVSGPESDAGMNTLTFNVSLDIPALVGGVTFDIATSDGTATDADNDYEPNSATGVTIPEGVSSTTFNVTVNGDTTFEANETFTVSLSNVTGATVATGTGTGTIQNDDAAPVNLSIADVTLAEGNTGTTTFGFVVTLDGPAPSGGVTFDIATSAGTATAGTDYVTKSVNGASIATGSTTYNFDVTVNGDWDSESNETFNVAVSNVSGAVVTDGAALGTITNDDSAVTPIHDIQGSGNTSASGTFTVDAIVVGQYQAQTSGQLKGFFVQEQDADADANPATSEGIFVYCLTCPTAVNVGDRVLATGATSEYFNMSQLNATTAGSVVVLSSGNAMPTPASLTLPVPGVPTGDLTAAETFINAYYEAFEGMLVKFPATLSVSEYFELARYGQVILSAGGRPHTFTAVNTPTALGYTNHQIDLAARTIILDDPDNRQNRPSDVPNTAYFYPVPGLSTTNYFRGGDTITNLTGVLHWSFAGQTGTDAWRIRPVTEKYTYTFTPVNTRPTVPASSGSLKVASFNVLNYFLTIDTSNVCSPTLAADCRGADSAQELTRQRTKMLAALAAIDADVFGFMEMENTPGVSPLADIVAGLPGYGYIDTGVIGGDAIRVGIIYKTATVTPLGAFKVLTSAVDPLFDDTKNRPALAQTFEEVATGEVFTVVVNHLKSKGSSCGAGDDDTTTGQGNCNLTRTEAAGALADWLATDPTGSGDPDFLIIGDLNSYAMEDPITALKTAGYTDLVNSFGGADAYGYVFDGQLGYLDHALSNASLTPQVAGVAEWHINADENPLFDYNDDVRTADEAAYDEESDVLPLYEPNQFRTSDHDPIIISLNLDSSGAPTITSIVRAGTNPTNAASVAYTVTFSEVVTGVDSADFSLDISNGVISGATIGTISGSGTSYTVNVNTGSGDGDLRLDVKLTATIIDSGSNNVSNLPYTSGQAYTIDKTAPTVTSIVRAGANPTNAASVNFTVTFSEAVTGVSTGDFSLTAPDLTGESVTTVTPVNGSTYTVAVNTGSGAGTLRLDIPAGASITDAAGNTPGGLPYTGGASYDVDRVAPTVVSVVRADPNPTNAASVDFTVTFSEIVTGVGLGDFALAAGSVSDASITGVSGAGTTYTVSVNTGTLNGTIGLDVPATASVTDTIGNALGGLPFTTGEVYTVSKTPIFEDVPFTHWANNFIERLYNFGVTGGCSTSPLNYCPDGNITRAQMAVFILRAKYGDTYVPPAASGTVFNDVAQNSFAAAYIEALVAEGITAGCGGGNYCPNKNITRAEMAVFILRGMYGNAYVPPTAVGDVFNDVPANSFAAAWIEALAAEGITGGCGGGNYCPGGYVTRAEMAVFLVMAFNLP